MMWYHNSKVMHLMWHHNSKMMYLMWHPIITRNIWCHFQTRHQLVPFMVSVEKVTLSCSDTLCLWWLVINVTIYHFPCSVCCHFNWMCNVQTFKLFEVIIETWLYISFIDYRKQWISKGHVSKHATIIW